MSPVTYTMSDLAYFKAVLHSAKYVSAVSGLLLGRAVEDENVRIEDALPICHSAGAQFSTPIAQCALLLAKSVAEQRRLQIIGVYYGNEIADDRSIGIVPTRLADKVRTSFPEACLLMIEASKLAPAERLGSHCFRVCSSADPRTPTWGKGAMDPSSLVVSKSALENCDKLLKSASVVQAIVDFEDHCADPSNDWFNKSTMPLDQEFTQTSKGRAS